MPSDGRALDVGVEEVPLSQRQPLWSGRLTLRVASHIPPQRRPAAVRTIRIVHTAAFFAIATCIAVFDWDGIRRRPGHRASLAACIALAEAVIYTSNNRSAR